MGDVWASVDGTEWKQSESLPSLPTPCHETAVINTGSPEYLIVAGGYSIYMEPLDTVTVLDEGQWYLVQRLPLPYGAIEYTIHNGNLYLFGNSILRPYSYYCEMDSLMTACEMVKSGTTMFEGQSVSWKTLRRGRLSCPVSFGQHLVAMKIDNMRSHNKILAYHPFTQSWVHVGNLPRTEGLECTFVHTTGELVLLCGRGPWGRGQSKVVKASLQGT